MSVSSERVKQWILRWVTYQQAEAAKTGLAWVLYHSGLGFAASRLRKRGACILLYHSIGEGGVFWDNQVSLERFRQQLDYLARRRQVVPMQRLLGLLERNEPIPPDWVVITFDDGYADNVRDALPALRERGLTASFFVTTGILNGASRFHYDDVQSLVEATDRSRVVLDWEGKRLEHDLSTPAKKKDAIQRMVLATRFTSDENKRSFLERLAEALGTHTAALAARPERYLCETDLATLVAAGCEVGSHTVTHVSLGHASDAEVEREVRESKALLDARTGASVTGLAYPFGKTVNYDARVIAASRSAGYRYALTTRQGFVTGREDPFALPRIGVRNASLARFKLRLQGVFL